MALQLLTIQIYSSTAKHYPIDSSTTIHYLIDNSAATHMPQFTTPPLLTCHNLQLYRYSLWITTQFTVPPLLTYTNLQLHR